jgi:hypothetical protein
MIEAEISFHQHQIPAILFGCMLITALLLAFGTDPLGAKSYTETRRDPLIIAAKTLFSWGFGGLCIIHLVLSKSSGVIFFLSAAGASLSLVVMFVLEELWDFIKPNPSSKQSR